MLKKNIAIDDLAVMVQKGFAEINQKFDARFDSVEGRLDKVEARLMKVEIRLDSLGGGEVEQIRKHQIAHTIYRDEFEKLQNRVKALEKLLI